MEDQEIHIRDYLRVLYKRRNTVIAFFYIVVTIVVTKTLLATAVYQATTRALIEKNEPQNVSLVNSYYMPWDPAFYETQVQLIKSVAIGERVVDMLDLSENYDSYMSGHTGGFSLTGFLKGLLPGDEEDGAEKAPLAPASQSLALAEMISAGLTVDPVKDSKVVNISYESTNPELAALIVNTVTKAYMEELLEMKMSSSRYAIDWMSEKAKEEATKLEQAERRLQAYMEKNKIITLENRVTIIPQRLSELSLQLTKAETHRKEAQALYEKISSLGDDLDRAETIPQVQQDQALQTLRSEILKAEQNIAELSKKYGEKHPAMVTAQRELVVLAQKRKEGIGRVVGSMKNEYEFARANEQNLRQRLAETKNEALSLNEKFIQYEVLKRAVETNRQFYNALMTKTKEHTITEQIQSINVWILEEAQVPKSPIRPRKYRSILLGIIVGLFGGVGMAFFVEYLDNTVKSPEETEAKTGLPVLGIVPQLREKGKSAASAVLDDPRSHLGESFKALRTSVLLSSPEKPPQAILVTSMVSGEGKTSTAINLAVATAMSNRRTLLVDGDLRKPSVHKVFGLKNVKGLSTYLAGVSDDDIVQATSVDNLSIIAPGPVPPNPSELLGASGMGDLILRLRDEFDIVIFDSSPILTVADSLVLSRSMDTVILVARATKTTFEMISRGVRSLRDINADILGIVINAYDEKRSGYYYYRYKDYNYIGEAGMDKPNS